ncbi:PAC motif-containing protein [Cynara cardunculus var. scolymus]|uniref:non-specific serine/threonine protein kinase n=1 Tax=Cynara cardunculus var. scolymus TaxID=59895 RepID=A0A103Y6S2_CYNCS|nr:PAC motif-containing protein [Cynara cardunculus var. scolymus]
MEPKRSSPVFLPAQRDVRGSLEVFNPSTNETTSQFRSQPTWRSWTESPQNHPEPSPPPPSTEVNDNVTLSSSRSGGLPADEINKSWMALKDPNPHEAPPVTMPPQSPPFARSSAAGVVALAPQSPGGILGAAEQRAAEWGLVLQTDTETGKPQGVKVRTSGEDPNAKPGSSRRDSGNSVQSSSDVSDDGLGNLALIYRKEKGFPRVSEDLKDALSTFQQTFVVSDATKPDYPILYASAARQKEMASSSVTELVEAVKRPRSLSESTNRHPFSRNSGDQDTTNAVAGFGRRNSAETMFPPPPPPPARRNSHAGVRTITTMQSINELPEKKQKKTKRLSFIGIKKNNRKSSEEFDDGFEGDVNIQDIDGEVDDEDDEFARNKDVQSRPESLDDKVRKKEMRKGIDLATTLERIEKNFVITDPRLPDNPIIFASDSFLELTEYSREEILGRNCRFLQGPETDPSTVKKIRDAIDNQREVTVQLINYTKSGKKFWNLFHLQPMRDQKGEVQYFIGVQLDGSQHVEPLHNCIPETTAKDGAVLVKETAENVDEAVRELPDANMVHRACAEREILDILDHPFLPALYASFQTQTHVCLITDYCPGGELFMLLDRQPMKVLKEDAVRFYAAEVLVALEYLHCQGIIYRDLKPENVLIQSTGHVALTDFDLSCLTSCKPQLLVPEISEKKKKKKKKHQKGQETPIFMAEPVRASNSFVGTEEYIAPEIISGAGHSSAVDWWALGKTRQRTFANVLHKDLKFPGSIPVSLQAKQLIYRLLHRDPKNRLGSHEGANEIKRHPFFRGINWALVRCQNPPKLETPVFNGTEDEKVKDVDYGLQDLENNVF